MKVVIIEDESLAAKRLESMIKKCDSSISIEAVLPSVSESVRWLNNNLQPDLLFMDVHLDDGQSFAIFDQIEVDIPVIFTTAYDDYMIKAFKVNSVDYLLKPIDLDELKGSINKYHKLHRNDSFNGESIKDFLKLALKKEPEYKTRFLITHGTRIKTVKITDIAYFYSEDKITFLITQEGQRLPVDYSLDKLSNIIDPKLFFRVNRQFLVKMEAITSIQKYSPTRLKICLDPTIAKDVFVSIEKYSAFKEWLDT